MLTNLIFCLNAVIPIFMMMILGMIFMKTKLFNDEFVSKLNAFVFKVALPVLVFNDLRQEDFHQIWDTGYVLFCFGATALSIAISALISLVIKNTGQRGEFIQISYRSSAAIMGIALVYNLYGKAGMTPLMIIGSVPLYNIMAVVVLSVFNPEHEPVDSALLKKTFMNVLKNPIIWGVFAGLAWSLIYVEMPVICDTTLGYIGRLATPLGLMAMGASFDIGKARKSIGFAGLGAFMKLIGLGLIFVPAAAMLGYTGQKLVAILIMCCSPATVSCYIMAKNLGHDGTLTSSGVMLSTGFSAFTLTVWLFAVKCLGLM